ncbi:hypothetical protein K6U06_01960 [Acidiferrimicrobium sp. IK]|uniref:hypothetical protein n=1 Tax=Acidiferrimicrobium sp. IK TaxID=2871700 RepID=UPI0021CAF0F9|nr:hypothetical protein [Acidiferrimicrobium sp. IK]MCU4183109.1 hypothetical protein [Acidiferrimicrobium sp. IK]
MPQPSRRRAVRALRAADGLVGAWVVAWLVIAVWIGVDVRRLGALSSTLQAAAGALSQTGNALHTLSHLPLVGHDLAAIAGRVTATAASASLSAASARSSTGQLSVLLPLVVFVVPVVPVLAAYVPLRLQRAREAGALRAALRESSDPARTMRFLAERAVAQLPFHRLEQLSPDPWADLEAGRLDALAGAEIERLGLDPAVELARLKGAPVLRSRSVS